MSMNPAIRQAIFGVSGIVIISKLIGFLREMVIAERFGTSQEYDIFLLAPYLVRMTVPDLDGENLSRGIFYYRAISLAVLSMVLFVGIGYILKIGEIRSFLKGLRKQFG